MAIGRFEVVPLIVLFSFVVAASVLGAQTEPVRVQACRDGAGGCVASTNCSVPTFRLRDDGCPSHLVCCPLATITIRPLNVVPAAKTYPTITNEPEPDDLDEEIVTESIIDEAGSVNQYHYPIAPAVHREIQKPFIVAPTYATNELATPDERETDEHRMKPWIALIFSTNHCCNGALISRILVLTIKTCWKKCTGKSINWTVRLGGWYSISSGVFNDQSVFKVRGPLARNNNPPIRGNHFEFLTLDRAVEVDNSIHPIRLPDSFSGATGNIMHTGKGNLTNQKLKIKTIQLLEKEWNQCQRGTNRKYVRKYFCAAPKDRAYSTWLSRSKLGSPVVVEVTGASGRHYILHGLIYKKKVLAGATVLAKVSYFRSWIDLAVNETWPQIAGDIQTG
uniref:Uncharacterized protein n=1 Tax=Anopheles albimanus TaxID=7167 RepID=A0A182FZF8_ANOAL